MLWSSALLHSEVFWLYTNASIKRAASIIMVEVERYGFYTVISPQWNRVIVLP
jgi:hypothetical protein